MGLELFLLIMMIIGLLTACMLLVMDKHHAKRENVRMEKMRNGELYQELSEIVSRCRKRYVEQVCIRRESVEFKMMFPAGRKIVFTLQNHGFRLLSPQRQYTLCQLLMHDIPVLADKGRYTLKKEKRPLPNGEKAVEYIYTMKIGYKDALNRAPYYT